MFQKSAKLSSGLKIIPLTRLRVICNALLTHALGAECVYECVSVENEIERDTLLLLHCNLNIS